MAEWTRVACEVADAIRSAECVKPTASKTDPSGTYGTPEIYTEWSAIYPSGREVPVLREHRWPGDEGEPDAKPCEHYVPRRHPMSEIVPADQIEQIVGITRHPTRHYARAVPAEKTVYILHSQECRDRYDDLRECAWSIALDRGIDEYDWSDREDQPVLVRVRDGRLIPDRGEGKVTLR